MIKKIISGGQTGADRAGLDWAIAHAIPHGGWCPKGRICEDGTIAPCYDLQETETVAYSERTRRNVRDSDGTVIFTMTSKLSQGSLLTLRTAEKLGKPCLHLAAESPLEHNVVWLQEFLRHNDIAILNVAGTRASKEPAISEYVGTILTEAFAL